MDVACSVCLRAFELDEARALAVRTARCVCGAVIDLRNSFVPRKLGKYLLQKRIGVGGMGEIFLAKVAGVEGFERQLAIKKMLPHLSADRSFVRMLVKEAKLTVMLNHPNLVQVFDLDKEGDEYYIAMEYVPSINVGRLLEYCASKGVTLPVPVALSIVLQTLKGLAYAHGLKAPDGSPMGILHRDINPQNILITEQGWVKVTDFGIAKARNEGTTTRPGMIRGKLGYLAPEQFGEDASDQRIDVFCAGVLVWESLALRRLFKGAHEMETLRLMTEAWVPSLSGIRSDVSPALEAAINKALTRRPDDRHPSAQAFYDALTAAVFPSSPDDCAKQTEAFLAGHSEAFDRLRRAPTEADTSDQPTLNISGALTDPSLFAEVTISDLVRRRPARMRRIIALAALLCVLLAGAAWWQRDLIGSHAPVIGAVEPAVARLPAEAGRSPPAPPRPASKPLQAPKPVADKPLSQDEIQATVQAHFASIAKCLQQLEAATAPAKVDALLTIQASGKVSGAELEPKLSSARVNECLTGTLKRLRFRASRDGIKLIIPLHMKRWAASP